MGDRGSGQLLSPPDTLLGRVGRLTGTAQASRSGGQPRVLVDQPFHPRAADHWTTGNGRE